MISLLLLEPDLRVADFLHKGLKTEGFRVTHVTDGNVALQEGMSGNYGVIVLDINVPGIDGMTVCSRLRRAGIATPIMFLTSHASTETIVQGLLDGADDYVLRPFDFDILKARLVALNRRRHVPLSGGGETQLKVGPLNINMGSREVHLDDERVDLTMKEFDILALMAGRPGRVFSRERILAQAWSTDRDPMTNVVDVYISRLRQKLPAVGIDTVRGAGYKLMANPANA